MSDNHTVPGETPDAPPVPQANPYAAQLDPYPSVPAAHIAPAQPTSAYPVVPQPYQVSPQPYQVSPQPVAQQPYQQPQQPHSYGAQPYPYATPRPTSGLAVTSLVAGIVGIVLSWTFVALLASIAAVITGHLALNGMRRDTSVGGKGMAIAGLVLGYIGAAILVITIIILVMSFMLLGSTVGLLPFFLS